ncbi:MAG: hypothetical protein M1281_20180 [Chloroflexi bacterium]|nr:hypothetical protein [Chloroflexota bacterium]
MDSIKHTRFLAKNYPQLQGLRAIPLSLCLLVITLWANSQQGPARDLTLPILLALGCLVFYLLVDRYYNRVYGRVKRTVTHAEMFLSTIGAVLALAAFIGDNLNITEVSLLGLVFAAVFAFTGFWYWRPVKSVLNLNLVLAACFAILSILPVVGIRDWWGFLGLKDSILGFTLLFGIFGVIGGLIFHIYFVRSLPLPPEAS